MRSLPRAIMSNCRNGSSSAMLSRSRWDQARPFNSRSCCAPFPAGLVGSQAFARSHENAFPMLSMKTRCELTPRTFVRPRSTSTAAGAPVSAEPLADLGHAVTIAGVAADAALRAAALLVPLPLRPAATPTLRFGALLFVPPWRCHRPREPDLLVALCRPPPPHMGEVRSRPETRCLTVYGCDSL